VKIDEIYDSVKTDLKFLKEIQEIECKYIEEIKRKEKRKSVSLLREENMEVRRSSNFSGYGEFNDFAGFSTGANVASDANANMMRMVD